MTAYVDGRDEPERGNPNQHFTQVLYLTSISRTLRLSWKFSLQYLQVWIWLVLFSSTYSLYTLFKLTMNSELWDLLYFIWIRAGLICPIHWETEAWWFFCTISKRWIYTTTGWCKRCFAYGLCVELDICFCLRKKKNEVFIEISVIHLIFSAIFAGDPCGRYTLHNICWR